MFVKPTYKTREAIRMQTQSLMQTQPLIQTNHGISFPLVGPKRQRQEDLVRDQQRVAAQMHVRENPAHSALQTKAVPTKGE
jgi:hypothetical protein